MPHAVRAGTALWRAILVMLPMTRPKGTLPAITPNERHKFIPLSTSGYKSQEELPELQAWVRIVRFGSDSKVTSGPRPVRSTGPFGGNSELLVPRVCQAENAVDISLK